MHNRRKMLALVIIFILSTATIDAAEITVLKLGNGTEKIMHLNEKDELNISVTYNVTGGDGNLTFKGNFDTGQSVSGIVDKAEKNAMLSLDPNLLSLGFGSYKLTLVLESIPSYSNSSIAIIVQYNEPVQDFQVTPSSSFIQVGDTVTFYVSMTRGSNIDLEYIVNTNVTVDRFTGIVRAYSVNVTFNEQGKNNVTFTASNTASSEFLKLVIYAMHPVSGFVLDNYEGPIETLEKAAFTLKLDPLNNFDMGEINFIIEYDDGKTDTFSLTSKIDEMKTKGYTFTHAYNTQGNFSISSRVESHISDMNLKIKRLFVWDKIQLNLKLSTENAKVDENVKINFINPPRSGFMYKIIFGDGDISFAQEAFLYQVFTDPQIKHSYKAIGIYEICMIARNPFYYSVYCLYITVQYPIPEDDMILDPPSDEIPIPGSDIQFVFNMTRYNEQPTNVTCHFDLGEAEALQTNVSTELLYGEAIIRDYTYLRNGTKNVRYTCFNLVSRMTKTATIIVRSFTLSDFLLHYQKKVNMNMTRILDDPDKNKIITHERNVYFRISLFSCSKFPPNITFAWDFGDGTVHDAVPLELDSFYNNHTYKSRGKYTIKIHMVSPKEKYTSENNIQLGVVEFSSSSIIGLINVTKFTFKATGINGPADYAFDIDFLSMPIEKKFGVSSAETKFIYSEIGAYYPSVIGTNESFYERVYLNEPIMVDYSIKLMTAYFSNTTIPLPYGNITVNISLPQRSLVNTLLDCTFHFNDAIDREPKKFQKNISADEPIIYEYHYLTLGRRVATINCSNLIENYYNSSYIDVVNPCFVVRGIYDRQYSHKDTAMQASSSKDTDVSSRMPVLCHSPMPEYLYEIEKMEGSYSYPIAYQPKGRPSGTIRFERGKWLPGTYKVALTVKLLSTWCYEFTFIHFERPEAQAMIFGGNKRSMPYADILVDGLTESYNQEGGYGDNEHLNFTWFCYKYSANLSDANDIEELFTNRGGIEYFSNQTAVQEAALDTACEADLFSDESSTGEKQVRGKMWLKARQNESIYFIIVMVISLEYAPDAKTSQIIKLIEGEPPSVRIECKINCRDKLALKVRFGAKAMCDDCLDYEEQYFEWFLFEYKEELSSYTDVPDLADITETGILGDSLVLRQGVLNEGSRYLLRVNLTVPYRKEPGTAEFEVWSNLPPYGGTCQVDKAEGNATSSIFKIDCPNWKDEGVRTSRGYQQDMREPLTYEYYLRVPRLIDGQEEIQEFPLVKAGESSASELLLPVGDENFDYNMTFLVKIIDRYGDFSVHDDCVVQSKPDVDRVPSSVNDTEVMNTFLENYNETYLQLKASGNIIAVIRYVGATASVFTGVNVTGADESAKSELQNKTTEFVTVFYDAISDEGNETREVMNAADSNNVIQNMKTCMQNKDLVNDENTGLAVKTVETLTRNMEARSNLNPYPVEDLDNMNKTVQGSLSIVDGSLDIAIPDELEDLEEELTLEIVEADLEDRGILIRTGNVSEIAEEDKSEWRKKLIQEEYDRRMKIRNNMISKKEKGLETVTKMVDAIEHMQDIQGAAVLNGENETVMERQNVRVTVEKTSIKDLFNRTEIDKKDMTIQMGNTTNATDTVELRTAVFNKVPYFYGGGADKLTSKGIMISLKNGTDKANVSLSVKIKNQGTPSYKFVKPQYIPGDSGNKMYFKANIRSRDDAMMVYIRPDNFDPGDFSSIGLYDVMITTEENRWSSNYEFKYEINRRDWASDQSAYKAFIPQGTIPPGKAFVIIKPVEPKALPPPSSYRRKRSAPDTNNSTDDYTTTEAPMFESLEANFSLIIMTTGCRTWVDSEQRWVSRGCTVLPFSTINETVCRCPEPQGQMFATTFYVPPNTIDFSAVWAKFDPSNASIYGTVIAILVAYALLIIWARRRDRSDNAKWQIRFLCDSDKDDSYFYLITVRTGMRMGSGTQSNVHFVLGGDEIDSGVRILSDGITQGFETGSVKKYIMGTQAYLGNILFLKVWHDNSGNGINKSWYLSEIIVEDPQTQDRYVFICDKWLAEDQDDGLVERHLISSSDEDLSKFQNMFSYHARLNLVENHLWLSLVLRPERSVFTRVQRMSCVLSLLFLAMITNAMFFRSQSDDVTADSVSIGSLRFSLTTLYISVVGILISTPPVILMTYIFQNVKPKQPKPLKIEEDGMMEAGDVFKDESKNHMYSDHDLYAMDGLRLPHWTLYIAWVTVFLSVLTSAFFLILYSMQWGKSKSEEWLISFILSFFESICVVDPFKVVVLAVLLAFLFRKPIQTEVGNLKMDTIKVLAKTFNAGTSRIYRTFRRHVLSNSSRSAIKQAQAQRRRREQESKAREALKEIIMYIFYAFIVYSIGYVNRDDRSFRLKDNIFKTLYTSKFENVKSYEGYKNWMKNIFFPQFFPLTYYDSNVKLDERYKQYFADLENTKIGPARLRQVRMKKVECDCSKLTKTRYCVPDYSIEKEDDDMYCVGWFPYDISCDDNRNLYTQKAWKYKTSSEIWGLTMIGDYSSYGGGGYILKLDTDLQNSLYILEELDHYKWIDRKTRAVFVEFTLYNANTNLFAYVVFLTEFTPFGGLTHWADAQIFRPYQHTGATGAYAICCYLVFLLVLLVNTVQIIKHIRKSGLRYFLSAWHFVDSLCALISYGAIAMWSMRLYYAQESLKVYYNDKKAFINFQHVVVWDYVLNVVVGVLIFIATLRILKVLGYNKRLTQIASVVTNAGKDLLGFFILFGFVFIAYVILGYLLFGAQLRAYKSVFATTGTLANALIGKNKLDSMLRAAPEMTQFYYFTYVLFVIFILLTMFAVILNQSISEVREETAKTNNIVGVLDVVTSAAKDVMGLFVFFKTSTSNQKKAINSKNRRLKNEQFDAPNVIRLVRDTFGKWKKEKEDEVPDTKHWNKLEDMMLMKTCPPSTPKPEDQDDQLYPNIQDVDDCDKADAYAVQYL